MKDLQHVLEEVIQVIQPRELPSPLPADVTEWPTVQQMKWLRSQHAHPDQLLETMRQGEQEFLQKKIIMQAMV